MSREYECPQVSLDSCFFFAYLMPVCVKWMNREIMFVNIRMFAYPDVCSYRRGMSACMNVCVYVCMQLSLEAYVCAHVRTGWYHSEPTCLCMCEYMYVYIYIYIYVYMYIYIYTYI